MLHGQVDPSEKLDPEVEDILMDIADDFVESVSNQTEIYYFISNFICPMDESYQDNFLLFL